MAHGPAVGAATTPEPSASTRVTSLTNHAVVEEVVGVAAAVDRGERAEQERDRRLHSGPRVECRGCGCPNLSARG
jgi:hypothetical protein